MLFCILVSLMLAAGGGVLAIYALSMFVKGILCPRIPAKIIAVRKAGFNSGMYWFTYEVPAGKDKVDRLERKVIPLRCALFLASPPDYVGRIVRVPYDTRKKSILPHQPILVFYFIVGLLIAALGSLILFLLFM